MENDELPIQRYQFNCQTLAPLSLNLYSGSMLRGAFGIALHKLFCIVETEECQCCMLQQHCTFPKIFAPAVPEKADFQKFSNIPSPYIIEPPPMGRKTLQSKQNFSFGLVLIGYAISELTVIIKAWELAFQTGLGKGKTKVKLLNVVQEPGQATEKVIYPKQREQQTARKDINTPPRDNRQIKLTLLTPLRIQQRGKILSSNMQGKDFLMAMVRRYYLLHEFYNPQYRAPDFSLLAKQAEQIHCQTDFQWSEWTRYSSRKKQKMVFSGVLGTLKLTGDLAPFLTMLEQGQWLHIGNKTSFGMGRYEITA